MIKFGDSHRGLMFYVLLWQFKGTLSQKRMYKIVLVKFKKAMFFPRHLLERNDMHGSISIENISFSRNCDIKQQNTKSVTGASIWVKFISKNSNTLEIMHSLWFKCIFRLDASASFRRRKTRRAGFGTHVNQSEHSHRTRCVIISIATPTI